MRAWLRHHREALWAGLRRLSYLNAIVVGIALALPTGGYAVLESLRPAGARLALEPRISLFLEPELDRNRLTAPNPGRYHELEAERVRGFRHGPAGKGRPRGLRGVPRLDPIGAAPDHGHGSCAVRNQERQA